METDTNTPPVLVVNAGSSSLKVKLLPQNLSLLVERIGDTPNVRASFTDVPAEIAADRVTNHETALQVCLDAIAEKHDLSDIRAVGHRVVHGGERYAEPVVIDDDVIAAIDELSVLAPLHNPPNLEGIRAAQRLLPGIRHVAVFDTGFHAALPPKAYLYAIPRRFYEEQGIRRYGFHGPSHDYVTRQAAKTLGRPREELRLISLHLGNGASAAAVSRGRSVYTSMGFTPLAGLVMGTRCGDIGPGVLLHLLRQGMSVDDLDQMLNKESGLLGLSGVSNDMRDLEKAIAEGNEQAAEALDVFCFRITQTVGSMAAVMGGLDAVVFTGGIGEHQAQVRADSLASLDFLGIRIDAAKNEADERDISTADATVKTLVIPTDEEQMIADATRACLDEV
ncbi:MAG: acetate kinase [Trueperaceae bacterium]|nr:acetate kinase [Trueperaceae bacterium]